MIAAIRVWIAAVRQSRLSVLLQEEVTQMIENLAQTWEQELLALGEARGRAEGEVLAYRRLLELQLCQRFGER